MFYQRLFIIVFGYIVVMLALSLRFLPDTIVSIVFIVSGGFGFCSAFSFVCGMLCPRINRKGSTSYHIGLELIVYDRHHLGMHIRPGSTSTITIWHVCRPATLLNVQFDDTNCRPV